jgi:ABC-type uncharacterized transport system permease subunit
VNKYFIYGLSAIITLCFCWGLWAIIAQPNRYAAETGWNVVINIPVCLAVGYILGRAFSGQKDARD